MYSLGEIPKVICLDVSFSMYTRLFTHYFFSRDNFLREEIDLLIHLINGPIINSLCIFIFTVPFYGKGCIHSKMNNPELFHSYFQSFCSFIGILFNTTVSQLRFLFKREH